MTYTKVSLFKSVSKWQLAGVVSAWCIQFETKAGAMRYARQMGWKIVRINGKPV